MKSNSSMPTKTKVFPLEIMYFAQTKQRLSPISSATFTQSKALIAVWFL